MLKTIGMIGGTSWESTALYYKLINESIRNKYGGLTSAHIVINSLNYQEVVALEQQNRWSDVGQILAQAAQAVENAGASFLILGCNTLHKVTADIENAVRIPFLHIADPAGKALQEAHAKKVGLLGTQFTMEEDFYSSRLSEKYGLEVVVPSQTDRKTMDQIIYHELCVGQVLEESRRKIAEMILSLISQGCEGIILGCTELGMIVKSQDSSVPLFDTTILHASRAVEMSTE